MNCTSGYLKQGVRPQAQYRTTIQKPTIEGGASNPEFASEVLAFVVELTARRGDTDPATHRSELSRIERVATSSGLSMDGYEVAVNGGKRRRVLAKSLKLGVVAIAARATAQNFARKQSLSPQRDQALRVEVLGVKRPESQFFPSGAA